MKGLLIDEIKQVTPMPDPGLRGEVGQASVSPDAVRHHVAEETSADARGARPAYALHRVTADALQGFAPPPPIVLARQAIGSPSFGEKT
ncbi:hypothetical protein ATE69_17185 [Sphingopyxis sp. H071]|nr:hypothetical protein ATE69_17185 [Sphingopyxis sp. H071]